MRPSIHGEERADARRTPESHDDLGAAAMDLAATDLDDLADGDRLIATEVEDSLQDEIGIEPGGVECGRVTGLECEGEECAGIEGPVVVGITRQDQAMGEGLCFLGLSLGHARVPRITKGGAGRSPGFARKLITPGGFRQLPRALGAIMKRDDGRSRKTSCGAKKTLRWRV